MGQDSEISWCHHTFNIAWGCIEATAGCDNCYARVLAKRYGFDVWGKDVPRRTFGEKHWREPLKWNAAAIAAGERHRVFSSSMTDNFLNDRMIDAERDKLWPLIAETPALDWLLLTKHPERFPATLPPLLRYNVWLGVSVEDNSAAWRVDMLRATHARVKFLSVEPMLGPIDKVDLTGIDWVIVGGESGPKARALDPGWARDVRDRCIAAGIAYHFKQWGEWAPVHEKRVNDEFAAVGWERAGKKAAGRDLDGRTWDEFPAAPA